MFPRIFRTIGAYKNARYIATVTSSSKQAEEKKAPIFKRIWTVIIANRQAVINIVGTYIIFAVAITNYNMKLLREKRESELEFAREEIKALRTLVLDDRWVNATESKILEGKSSLKKEMELVVAAISEREILIGNDSKGIVQREKNSSTGQGLKLF